MTSVVERRLRRVIGQVSDGHPLLRRAALRAWSGYVRLYPELANGVALRRLRREATVEPFAVVDVDPDRIEYILGANALPRQTREGDTFPDSKFKYAGRVVGGDWDDTDRRFTDSELYRSFRAHFEDGVDWAATPFFETVVDHIQRGTVLWGCTTAAEFRARCRELDRLYEAIRTHGFLSQRELTRQDVRDPVDDRSVPEPHLVRLVNHELTVCVGRDGELLFMDGRDRLAMAKLLDVETVPVWILVRHRQWQQLRTAVERQSVPASSLTPAQRSHPDLSVGTDVEG
jgi:hypothetical protein